MADINVFVFFVVGALGFAFLAFRFISSKAQTLRSFGIGLALLAVAFLVWAAIIYAHPVSDQLALLTTIGVVPFGLANYFFVSAGTSELSPNARRNLLLVAAVVLALLFVVRTFVWPSQPEINSNGLFYFKAHPVAILLYVAVFAGALMPAVHVVTSQLKERQTAIFTRLFFNLVTLSAVVLLVSTDDELQKWNGYVLLIGLIGLVVTHARKTPAAEVN